MKRGAVDSKAIQIAHSFDLEDRLGTDRAPSKKSQTLKNWIVSDKPKQLTSSLSLILDESSPETLSSLQRESENIPPTILCDVAFVFPFLATEGNVTCSAV